MVNAMVPSRAQMGVHWGGSWSPSGGPTFGKGAGRRGVRTFYLFTLAYWPWLLLLSGSSCRSVFSNTIVTRYLSWLKTKWAGTELTCFQVRIFQHFCCFCGWPRWTRKSTLPPPGVTELNIHLLISWYSSTFRFCVQKQMNHKTGNMTNKKKSKT